MKELVEKLEGHTDHLLGCYLGLYEKYAFLKPMLFDNEVVSKFGTRSKARGYNAIKYSLYYDCIQDLAKITLDSDKRTPSIQNIMNGLEDAKAVTMLRDKFSEYSLPSNADDDEFVKEALIKHGEKESEERSRLFDKLLDGAKANWAEFKDTQPIGAFKTIRDKLTAHLELKKVDSKYQFTDISELGLKWGDVGEALDLLKTIVMDLNLIIRNVSFDMEGTECSLGEASLAYWDTKSTNSC